MNYKAPCGEQYHAISPSRATRPEVRRADRKHSGDMMEELVNFSVYHHDTDRFDGDWRALERFIASFGLDGVELLIGFDTVPEIPHGLVRGVHLPSFMGWLRVWEGSIRFPETAGDREIGMLYGARTAPELQERVRTALEHAALLSPEYAVFHACYIEPAQVYAAAPHCDDAHVLEVLADFLNRICAEFPGGEPPVRILFENLWWQGLTFLDGSVAEGFSERLAFDNWGFMFDTGHVLAALRSCATEDEAVDALLSVIAALPDAVADHIEGVHLHCSLHPEECCAALGVSMPGGFEERSLLDQYREVMGLIAAMDQHQPFSTPRCAEVVEALDPEFCTHEFVTRSLEEFRAAIARQHAAINGIDARRRR
jgi:hypothetical protein